VAAVGCGVAKTASCAEVEYEGTGQPDLILVSDLPLQGGARTRALQITDAVRAELRAWKYKAGDHTIGFRACDNSTASSGRSDPGACSANATAHADDDRVIGVIGPLDSSCATILIPVLNVAPGGAIPMISPSTTYPCLTRGGAGCDVSEPAKYYPSGDRNYLRVVANDVLQGAAGAQFLRERGIRRVYVLHDGEAYGVGVATSFRSAADSLGIEVVGFEGWSPEAPSYAPLFDNVASSRADAVFLGGLIDQNGRQVIEGKVARLGPNDGRVTLLAPDGFASPRKIARVGAAADGMYVLDVGVPFGELPRETQGVMGRFAADYLGGKPLDPGAVYGAQAAQIMLGAISQSNGTRADVTARLFASEVTDGLLGTFGFDENGDPDHATGPVVGFTIFKVARGLQVETTVSPESSTVEAVAP